MCSLKVPGSAILAGENILYAPTRLVSEYNRHGTKVKETEGPAYTRKIPVQEPSLSRRISVLFWTIIKDMWISLSSYIGAHSIQDDNTDVVDRNAFTMQGTDINRTIQSLRKQTKFNSIGVHQYCNYLAETYDAQYVSNCVVENQAETDVEDFPVATHDKIFIPIVLKGLFEDHIVTLYITRDDDTATIEFFDSKGLTIADRLDQTLVGNPDMTLGKLVAQLADHYCPGREITVIENTKKIQSDCHNCGIFVCHFLKARLTGTDLDQRFHLQSLNIYTWRKGMINDLMPTFLKALVENQYLPDDVCDEPKDIDSAFDPQEHAVMQEVHSFNAGGISFSDNNDDDEFLSDNEEEEFVSIAQPTQQTGFKLLGVESDIVTDLVDVSLKD